MKLVSFQSIENKIEKKTEQIRVGIRLSDSNSSDQMDSPQAGIIVDFGKAVSFLSQLGSGLENCPELPPESTHLSMISFIENLATTLPAAKAFEKAFSDKRLPQSVLRPESLTTLLSPIPRPLSMRDGYAFRQHVEAARRNRGVPMIPEFDEFPVFYFTNHLAVSGPGPITVRPLTQQQLDFELEVAIVIGKTGRNISAANADSHIFGYMIMNDWSARKLQMDEMKLNLGPAKGKDFSTTLGPYLVTPDELESHRIKSATGDRYDLRMKAFLNGKQLSDGNVKDMTWTFAQILERASYGVTLYPGEVIGSGTVGTGCLLELNGSKITDNLWVKPGDTMILEVQGLGTLKNTVEHEA
jgi:fumarylacetoacetate (FAA) hydrolase